MEVVVEWDWGSRTVSLKLTSYAEKLYLKWKESQDDDDWDNFCEYIFPDVAEAADIYIDDVREVN